MTMRKFKTALVLLLMLAWGGRPRAQEQVGPPSIGVRAFGRQTAQSAADANVVTYNLPAQDGSFLVSANTLITAFTAGSYSITVTYTDEGNTSRTLTLPLSNTAGTVATTAGAAGPFSSAVYQIRCKASTSIVVATSGTFTTLTYNVEATIRQVN